MSASFSLKFLAGAIALAVGGSAMANTSLDAATTGDVFVNIVDTTNSTSFLFDTGVSQANFNSATTQSFSFASDPNYTAFLAAKGATDSVDYSVFSATGSGTRNAQTVFFTSSIPLPAQTGSSATSIISGISTVATFLQAANATSSTTANSANLSGTTQFGTNLNEGSIAASLLNSPSPTASGGYVTDAALGTALAFYDDAAKGSTVNTYGTAFAGTWNVTGGVATYTVGGGAPVPLPTPVLLLLSGLGLMGVVTRRNKTT